jgi:hypothetical protein
MGRNYLHSDQRISGSATADRDFISAAAQTILPKQLAAFTTALGRKRSRLENMSATLGGVHSEHIDQFDALTKGIRLFQ